MRTFVHNLIAVSLSLLPLIPHLQPGDTFFNETIVPNASANHDLGVLALPGAVQSMYRAAPAHEIAMKTWNAAVESAPLRMGESHPVKTYTPSVGLGNPAGDWRGSPVNSSRADFLACTFVRQAPAIEATRYAAQTVDQPMGMLRVKPDGFSGQEWFGEYTVPNGTIPEVVIGRQKSPEIKAELMPAIRRPAYG
jgi:hypothetical protein